MHPRIDTTRISPGAYKAMHGLQSYVDATSLEPSLRELINIRASQINGRRVPGTSGPYRRVAGGACVLRT